MKMFMIQSPKEGLLSQLNGETAMAGKKHIPAQYRYTTVGLGEQTLWKVLIAIIYWFLIRPAKQSKTLRQ